MGFALVDSDDDGGWKKYISLKMSFKTSTFIIPYKRFPPAVVLILFGVDITSYDWAKGVGEGVG